MNKHLNNLEELLGPLRGKKVLDLGASNGDFLMGCNEKGVSAEGVEFSHKRVAYAMARALKEGMHLLIRQGRAENVSSSDSSFDFINASELLEHVDSPEDVLAEVRRLLTRDGICYMSVHNRFGFHEKHYRVRGLNWMPRMVAELILTFLGRQKNSDGTAGRQRLSEMHYYTFGSFSSLVRKHSLLVFDTRNERLRKKYGPSAAFLYRLLLRPWYSSTFHTLLIRSDSRTECRKAYPKFFHDR